MFGPPPYVLDAVGDELRVGDSVERCFPASRSANWSDQRVGGMVGTVDVIGEYGTLCVCWNRKPRLRSIWPSRRRFPLFGRFQCPDLRKVRSR